MATYIKLQFNDNVNINVSTSSFLFKNSNLLQLFDLNNEIIPILCPISYVLDNDDMFLFDDKNDLFFIFTLLSNKFIQVCKFLDIICYENKDNIFSKHFIMYVMKNIRIDIQIIHYFMKNEIRSIMNCINKEDINLQIKSCTFIFYHLYLTEYKEEVIKHNRYDIYDMSDCRNEYYRYIHKYDNTLTNNVKQTRKYNDYIMKLNKQVINEDKDLNNIKDLIERGANINFQNVDTGHTILCNILRWTTTKNVLEIVTYLVEQGINVNLQDNTGWTALHYASRQNNNLEVVKYLVEHGANIHIRYNNGCTALHHAERNIEIVKYLIEQGVNIHQQTNNGNTILHFASRYPNNLEVIKYLIDCGINVNLQNNDGWTALHFASNTPDNLEVIKYLVEHGADVKIRNNDDEMALHVAYNLKYNTAVTNYLINLL